MICRHFEQAAADKNTALENEVAAKLGATRLPDPFGSNHLVLKFRGKVPAPDRIQAEGEFDCSDPDCQVRGRTKINYPNRPEHTAALSRGSADTVAVYDPSRGEYSSPEVINSASPHCQHPEVRRQEAKGSLRILKAVLRNNPDGPLAENLRRQIEDIENS